MQLTILFIKAKNKTPTALLASGLETTPRNSTPYIQKSKSTSMRTAQLESIPLVATHQASVNRSIPRSPAPRTKELSKQVEACVRSRASMFVPHLLYLFFATVVAVDVSYFSDWSMMGGRPVQPTCVDIPRNMTLCHDIGYTKMRLPNLLDHDTMAEVSQQAGSWVPLLNIECHPDTQLFLCSLFSPVCLDRPIYPCRSLCDKVRTGCEGRMRVYGYPWPDFLRCEKFPLDNDMCITAQSGKSTAQEKDDDCLVCSQVETYENILDHFCRAEFAVKTKVRKVKKTRISCRKSKVYKTWSMDKAELRTIRRPTFVLDNVKECCSQYFNPDAKDNYLVMGVRRGSDLVPTFIMPWNAHSRPFRSAVRIFKRLDCADPKMVSESMIGADTIQTNNKSVRRAPKNKKKPKSTTHKPPTTLS